MRKFFSAPYWVHLLIDTIISQGIWWILSMIFETPILARSIIAGVMLIAGMFCVALYLPKLAPQYTSGRTKPSASIAHGKPSRLEHDGVLWEDSRVHFGIDGPLCPKDLASLCTEYQDNIEDYPHDDKTISNSEYHRRLFCPECKSKYTLGEKPKTIQQSRGEVSNRFGGKRKREE